jgi:hypothetical protein
MRVDALILRAEKLTLVPWRTSFDFNAAGMHVERKKRGRSPRHPIRAPAAPASSAADAAQRVPRSSCHTVTHVVALQ